MARTPRIDIRRLDLEGFEAWLRAQLTGTALSAVLVVVLQIIRALFEQNTQLRQRITGQRAKPPSERLAVLERQIAFPFVVPSNDVRPASPAETPPSDEVSEAEEETPRRKRRRGVNRPLPSSIATITVPNDVPDAERLCGDCGCEMTTLDHRDTSYFELLPAKLQKVTRRDETIACPHCDAIRTAKAPFGLLDGGTLGPTLVTEALADKVLDGMPIERTARSYQREGAPIAASTLGRSVGALLDELAPLADLITARVKQSSHVQFDATGLRVLDPTAITGIHRDSLWVIVGDGRWVRFAALASGDSEAIEAFMRGADAECFQCDGTSVTNFVEKKWGRCRPGCHAHARRRLVEAARRGDLRAMEPLRLYSRLFQIERTATRKGLDAQARLAVRAVESVPVLEAIRAWVMEHAASIEPKSTLGEAVTYLQRQWMRLQLFLLDGEIEVTNNRSERELRPWVQGQHAWLFVGDQVNAERWAAGFSLLHSAMAHGVNPRAYLHAIVPKLISRHPRQRLHELLPDAMLRSNPELADRARRTSSSTPDSVPTDAAA